MMYSYPFTLCKRGVVITMDLSAKNLTMFRTDHWLSNPENCFVLRLAGPAWCVSTNATPPLPQPSAQERVAGYTTSELRTALTEQDMCGPAEDLFKQGVDGADFLSFTPETIVNELRLSPFVAKKLCKVRAALLQD